MRRTAPGVLLGVLVAAVPVLVAGAALAAFLLSLIHISEPTSPY